MKKLLFCLCFTHMSFGWVMAACPAVPSAPATVPLCAALTELPWSTGNNLANSTNYGVGTLANSCGNTITFSGTHSLGGGNTSTNIYIKNGETLVITGSINTSFVGNIYVLAGGTLRVDQNINGGNIYVYGTLTHNPSSNVEVTNNAAVYVASGALYNAGNFELTGSGKMIVEGSFITTKLRYMLSSSSQFCLNNSGCAGIKAVEQYQGSNNPIFTTDNGNGYIYYLQNTCPVIAAPKTYTSSGASLTVCAPNLPNGTTCSAFGNATQRAGSACTAPVGCATVVALPVTMLYFKAKKSTEGVSISWATAAQQNAHYFVIMRSQNGISWEEIGTVDATKTSGGAAYSMIDNAPAIGTNYYKLQEVDLEMRKKDYSIDFVTISLDDIPFFVAPNPSNGTFSISVSDAYPSYEMEILDLKGTVVGKYVLFPGKNSFSDIGPAGVYFAQLRVGGARKTQKILIQ